MSLRAAFVLLVAYAFVAPTATSCHLFEKSSSEESDDDDDDKKKKRKKHDDEDEDKPATTATATAPVPAPIPAPVTPPTSADSTGIPECDDLLARMQKCGGTPPADAARIRDGYRQGAAVAREQIAQGCRSALEGNPVLKSCGTAAAGSTADCIKLVGCCRAVTSNPTADARLNVRLGTATREDSLKSCDEMATAPPAVCVKAYETTKDAIRTKLPPNVQQDLAAACP